ncbi:hypothetical protein [Micromonospora sp. NPDC005367]|uniref:hypothetical protein n=1 Tax=Micromonospora sp. NPDC005367 TaxID=3155590 RepID=UPI0033A56D07
MVIRRPDDPAAGAGTPKSGSREAVAGCCVSGSVATTCAGTGADFFGAPLREAGTFPAAAFFARVLPAFAGVLSAGVLFVAVAAFAGVLSAGVLFVAVAAFAGVRFAAALFAGVRLPAIAVFAGVLPLAVVFPVSGVPTGPSSRPVGAAGGSAGPVRWGADFRAGVRFVPAAAFRGFGALTAGPCRSPPA